VDGEIVDVGLVGDIVTVDTQRILIAIDAGQVPVISTVAATSTHDVLNVNADTGAAAIAAALGAGTLVVLTDVEGLYRDWPASNEVVASITAHELRELLPTLSAGMVPKMEACLRAVEAGVPRAHIIDGRVPHGLLVEIFTDHGVGTLVLPDEVAS
jgi:acetylglutamate kinase